jgi:hypothetical protein
MRRYYDNKNADVGDILYCPSCSKKFKKKHWQQVFCKHKDGTQCKDKYHNTVTPEKKNNTTRISPANAAFREKNFTYKKTKP